MEAYSKNISVKWDETEVVKPILRHTRPMIAESLEILRRSETEELVNDRLTWEPAPAWRYVVGRKRSRSMRKALDE